MSATGIIAEYNPFHNGHLYHLQETRRIRPDRPVICVMSGHFLQRGEPAMVNKWARAEMAVRHGVDLVLELPVLYSCRSAYWFGRGSLEILAATGVTSHFSFGAEDDKLDDLQKVARLLAEEDPSFQETLRQGTKKGLSYPRARSEALQKLLGSGEELWNKPNNVLALAYLQALHELKLPLTPILVRRKGAGYNEIQLQTGQNPSATALRSQLNAVPLPQFPEALESIRDYLPPASYEILNREYSTGRCPVQLESLAPQVLTLLRRSSPEEIARIVDVNEGLEGRLGKASVSATTLSGYLASVKTKRFTYTRLQRFLIHLLLNYTKEKEALLREGPPYLRVLAFNKTGRDLLKKIKAKTALPVIIKGAQGKKIAAADPVFRQFWEMDTLASDLYTLLYPQAAARTGAADYLLSPVLDKSL